LIFNALQISLLFSILCGEELSQTLIEDLAAMQSVHIRMNSSLSLPLKIILDPPVVKNKYKGPNES